MTMFWLGAWLGVFVPLVAVGVVVAALFLWEWRKHQDLVHIRRGRSGWEKGDGTGSHEYQDAVSAAVATGRWLWSIWVRGGWRIIVTRDGLNNDEGWTRFIRAKNAIEAADVEMLNRLRPEPAEGGDQP